MWMLGLVYTFSSFSEGWASLLLWLAAAVTTVHCKRERCINVVIMHYDDVSVCEITCISTYRFSTIVSRDNIICTIIPGYCSAYSEWRHTLPTGGFSCRHLEKFDSRRSYLIQIFLVGFIRVTFRPFEVIQGRWFWMILVPIESAYATS